jgi:hypothetical protein
MDGTSEVMVDELLREAFLGRQLADTGKNAWVGCAIDHPITLWKGFYPSSVSKIADEDLGAQAFQGGLIRLTTGSHQVIDDGDAKRTSMMAEKKLG